MKKHRHKWQECNITYAQTYGGVWLAIASLCSCSSYISLAPNSNLERATKLAKSLKQRTDVFLSKGERGWIQQRRLWNDLVATGEPLKDCVETFALEILRKGNNNG